MNRILAAFSLLLLLATPALALPKPSPIVGALRGETIEARTIDPATMPRMPVKVLPDVLGEKVEGVNEEAEAELEQLKSNPKRITVAELNQLTIDPNTGTASPLAPTLGTGFEGISQGPYIPAEPTVAVGPLNIFSAGNVSVTFTNKDGTNRVETDGATFFGVPAAEGAISDAQCYYDAIRGRFIAVAFTQGTSPSNYSNFYLAISKTNDCRGQWWLYKLDMTKDGTTATSNWSDYEALGVSDDKIALTGQQFTFSGDNYVYQKVRILDRAAAYSGGTLTYFDFVNFSASTGDQADVFVTKAARNLTAGDNTIHLFCVRTNGGTNVTYREVTGPPSAPVLGTSSKITCSSYAAPADAVQKGSSTLVPTNDCRPTDFYVRNGVLTVAWHSSVTINSTTTSGVRLFQLRCSDRTVLTDETFGAQGVWLYYPAVTVDSVGTVYLGFDRSSSTEYPSCYATGKRRSDATLQPAVLQKAGLAATSHSRWGDYTGIDNDASASGPGGTSAWYAGQYTKAANTFGNWINKLSFTYGQIGGQVTNDCDGTALTTGDRTAIAGVTVTLKQGATTLATTLTDASGNYNFGYLESGTYDVIITPPSGGVAIDAIVGTGATSQTRISGNDLQVNVTNAQTAVAQNFVVAASKPAPALSTIVPSTKSVGDAAFTLTVNGANFTSCSTVQLDGSARTTTFLSATQLTAAIPQSDLLAGGTHAITVSTPTPGGGTSGSTPFVVSGTPDTQAPVVTVTSPVGGESWSIGSVHNITWTATDDIGVASVDLALSTDGGATFPTAIATGLANSGTYAWTLPQTVSTTARVRVTARDGSNNAAADSSHANFTIFGWTITASAGANGAIAPNGSTLVGDGATPSYTITPNLGFGVSDVLVNGVSVGAVTNYQFPAVHANQTIAASFGVVNYTVTLATNGPGTAAAAPDQANYPYGTPVTLTATPSGGSVFSGWTGDTTTTTNPLGIVVTRNRSLTANFAWPITATAGSGGTITPAGTTNVVNGGSQAYTIAANAGYAITSVIVDGVSAGSITTYTFTNVTAPHTISATFTATGGGAAYPMAIGNYLEPFGDIANWTNNFASGIGASYWHAVPVQATGTIPDGVRTTVSTATFTTGTTGGVQKGTGTIVLLSTGTTDNSSADAIDLYLDYTGVTAGTLSYDFNTVANGTGNRNSSLRVFTSPDGATFTELPAADVLNFTNNVAFSQSVTTVALPASFTNNANARVRFYYHNGSGGTTGSRPKASIDNVAITGTPLVTNYTITASAGANGSITPSGAVSVASGGSQSFTITPSLGYHVADVLVDGGSVGAVTSYNFTNVLANHTIAASFAIETHTLTVNVVGSGSVTKSPNAASYAYGTPVQLTATPSAGFAFLGWSGDTTTATNPLSIVLVADRTYTATFADTTAPSVTVLAPNGGGSFGIGQSTNVTWSASDNIAVTAVDLLLSRNGAAGPFDTLTAGIANTGSWPWTVTGPATADARVKIIAHDAAGHTAQDLSDASFAIVSTTGVEDGPVTAFALGAVMPNPARGHSSIGFALPQTARVHLGVLDVQGREILALADGEFAAGRHQAVIATSQALSPGLYFVRLTTPGHTFVRRFAIVR